jgi:hydrogenase maturation protein HypF
MLPTTALHARLADALGPLVATSGNLEGDPLAYDDAEANADLAGISDAVLRHDRAIERPVDDSVVRGIAGTMVTLRLARGFAPAQLPLGGSSLASVRDSIVALGGHQKAACAFWNGEQAALGPFVGDLDSLAIRRRYVEQLAALRALFGIAESATITCDAHPDYFTTRLAAELARDDQRVIHVQHHHAHIVAAMLEHHLLDRRVLGVAWDGTGWGPDGTIWGGEFLESSAGEFQRRARLRPLLLPGGETAIRQPWRTTAWLLRASRSDGEALARRWLGESRCRQFAPLGERPWPGIWTSSIGRLFDAVAMLVLPESSLPQGVVEYEGQAAVLLEDLAEQARDVADPGAYPLPLVAAQVPELDWRPLIAAVAEDRLRGIAASVMARRFHEALAEAIGAVGARFPALPIALGGGVFQNRWLVERVVEWGERAGRLVVFPAKIPPNDGGLAAGQLVVAMAQCASQQTCV